jgi:hypothetical protein
VRGIIHGAMNDTEIRDALIAICETLKAEFRYLGSLQNSHVRFYDAVKAEMPEVEKRYRERSPQGIRDHPETSERIQLIDELLKKLRKP